MDTGTSTRRPVARADLVDTILDKIGRYGSKSVREQHALGSEGMALAPASQWRVLTSLGRAFGLGTATEGETLLSDAFKTNGSSPPPRALRLGDLFVGLNRAGLGIGGAR